MYTHTLILIPLLSLPCHSKSPSILNRTLLTIYGNSNNNPILFLWSVEDVSVRLLRFITYFMFLFLRKSNASCENERVGRFSFKCLKNKFVFRFSSTELSNTMYPLSPKYQGIVSRWSTRRFSSWTWTKL